MQKWVELFDLLINRDRVVYLFIDGANCSNGSTHYMNDRSRKVVEVLQNSCVLQEAGVNILLSRGRDISCWWVAKLMTSMGDVAKHRTERGSAGSKTTNTPEDCL